MAWSVIISAILRIVGPLIEKWLEDRLRKASVELPQPHADTPPRVVVDGLFHKAADGLAWWEFRKRRALDRAHQEALVHSESIVTGAK